MLKAVPPPGYRADDSGVLIPTDVARARIVLTKDDTKKIDAATRVATKLGLQQQFACKTCGPSVRLELIRDMATGFKKLVCHCSDRVLTGGV